MNHDPRSGGSGSRPQRPMFDQDAASSSRSRASDSGGYTRPARQGSTVYRSSASSGRTAPAYERTHVYKSQSAPVRAGYGASGGTRAERRRSSRPVRRKKKVWGKVGVIALSLVLVVVIGAVSLYAYVAAQLDATGPDGGGVLPDEGQTLPEYTGKGIVNFLVCGLDYDNEGADGYSSDEKIGRTDMILYVHYDTINGKVAILQLPRDTFVGEQVETGGTGKINGLYFFAPDKNARMAALTTVLNSQYKLPVDFYITIDMDAVKELIRTIGTIDVYVSIEVSDPEHPEAVIPVGWRAFTAEEAEFFLRNRHSPTYHEQGDIMRLQMQQSFYSALFREFKSLSKSDLAMWMRVLLHYVKTDKEPLQLAGLALKALDLGGENLTFVRPPCGESLYGTRSLITLDGAETARLLNEYFRPEGESYTVDELDIKELPRNNGTAQASVRTMQSIQAQEPPKE